MLYLVLAATVVAMVLVVSKGNEKDAEDLMND